VARRGARVVIASPEQQRRKPRNPEPERSAPEPWRPDEWVQEREPLRKRATKAVARGDVQPAATRPRTRRKPPPDVAAELAEAVPERRIAKAERQVVEAARAFERGRAQDAWRMLRPLVEEAPDAVAIRELAGLSLYHLGRWKQAIAHLEAFARLTGSVEQHPVLADCYRALGRHRKVEELWDELRQSSPGSPLVTEGRIVMAGSLADRGEVRKAIALLERGPMAPKRPPATHHLRLWYALADLYERAGETQRARQLFERVVQADPELADAAERLQALS
jgi:tetratricopeptide (TPR) repeat protein